MKLSDLIQELEDILAKDGDLPVAYFDGAESHAPVVIHALHRTGNGVLIHRENTPAENIRAQALLQEVDLLHRRPAHAVIISGRRRWYTSGLIQGTPNWR